MFQAPRYDNALNPYQPRFSWHEAESLQLLASAAQLLENSIDYETTLENIAQLLVSSLATWCSIDLVSSDGKIERVSGAHHDPIREHLVDEVLLRYPASPSAQRGVYRVIRTGQPILVPHVTEADWAKRAEDPNHFEMIMKLGSKSYMCVPLIARGRIVGSIMLLSEERTYGDQDLATAVELARCIAMAVDNVRMFRQMQEAVRVRDEFLAVLSHELRTPLNVIQGWVEILKNETLDKAGFEQAVDILDRNSKIQARMIHDLLDVSRFISGKFSSEKKSVELVDILKTSIESAKLQMEQKNIRIEQHLEKGPLFILGDSCHLHRMFTNVLSNAVKFTPRDGSIKITLRTIDGMAEVRIRDSGKGISSHFIPHVFEVFRQENSTSARGHDGLGLGLAIAKHIVEQHDGKIGVTSEGEGQGSEFTFLLPLTKKIDEPKRRAEGVHLSVQPLRGIHILLVDDAADMRFLLTRYLEKSGADVVAVSSAQMALSEMQKLKPDILLSDIGMPDEDGYSLIKKIRQLPKEQGGNTKAIALTAYAREQEKEKILSAGFDGHLSKPIFGLPLIEKICELLAR